MPPLILVTGATGYIASLLIPRLLERGYRVRALARHPERLRRRKWYANVEMVQGDVMDPATLMPALDGIHTAYYLIHNMSRGHGYIEAELQGARNFSNAAGRKGIEHIIYLGGLADPEQHIAPHLRSRIDTGRALREGEVPVTEFRAGVIAGSGSISFEMIRFMTELFPIIPAPEWIRNRSQPIAIQNVIDYLISALENKSGQGGVFEIGGPEITTYADLMLRYACARGLKRKMLLAPRIPVWFMAFGVNLMTPVPFPIASALIGGLSADSVVKHPGAQTTFPGIDLVDFDTATRKALELTHPDHIQRVWEDGGLELKSLKHEGCFVIHKIFAPGGKQPKEFIRSHIRNYFGELWIEHRLEQADRFSRTIIFHPQGLPGFLYWYLIRPFLRLGFFDLFQKISG
ncbi:MAG: NAD-dependent epimerase/dehydratase family protein [Chloroflexi bacterium]|nr:MAG: NAD-dependent epimerase/dehydratase family protein [Chloroflexota bacterium]